MCDLFSCNLGGLFIEEKQAGLGKMMKVKGCNCQSNCSTRKWVPLLHHLLFIIFNLRNDYFYTEKTHEAYKKTVLCTGVKITIYMYRFEGV